MSTRWANLVTDPPAKVGHEGSDPARLRQVFDVVRADLKALEDLPEEVIAQTHEIGAEAVRPARDRSAVPFLTIAPQGARDVGQAIHVERAGHGYRVPAAIADIAVFVRPGDQLDLKSCRRGQAVQLGGKLHLLGGLRPCGTAWERRLGVRSWISPGTAPWCSSVIRRPWPPLRGSALPAQRSRAHVARRSELFQMVGGVKR